MESQSFTVRQVLENSRLINLIDLPKLKGIFEIQFRMNNLPVCLMDELGQSLFSIGGQALCEKYHHHHPIASQDCIRQSLEQKDLVLNGKYQGGFCPLGLRDIALPIRIEGKHLGTLFFGQFLYESDRIDSIAILAQARKFSFSEEEYFNTILDVPRFKEKEIADTIELYKSLIDLIVDGVIKELQKIAEDQFNRYKEETERFINVFSNSPVGKSITYLNGSIENNRMFAEMLGYNQEELRQKNWREITHPDDIAESKQVIQDLLDGKTKTANFEKRYIKKNGEVLWTDVHTTLYRDKNGDPEYFITSIQDISGRKKIQSELIQSEARHRTIYESATDAFIIIDQKGEIFDVNPAACKLYQYSRDEFIGMNALQIVHESGRQVLSKFISDIKTTGSFKGENIDIRKDGKSFLSEVRGSVLKLEKEDYLLGVIRDITEEKGNKIKMAQMMNDLTIANKNLEEANASKDRLISVLAHDLKSPFNSLIGLMEIVNLQYDEISDENKKIYLKKLLEMSRNTHGLLENILTWARANSNSIKAQPNNLLVKSEVLKTTAQLKPYIKNKNLKLKVEIPEKTTVWADKMMFTTIISNLLSNSIKFCKPGASINIKGIQKNNTSTVIQIKDEGIGISEKNLSEIFDSSKIFTTEGTNREKGTGFGLIICKEFIELNQGNMEIDSVPGSGTTIRVNLPSKPLDIPDQVSRDFH
jgi:PAS domain S-box-containing protein